MIPSERSNRLDRPVDQQIDHVLGPEDAEITLVEYGGYDCPTCRAANEVIACLGDEDLVFLAICTPRFLPEAYEDIGAEPGR